MFVKVSDKLMIRAKDISRVEVKESDLSYKVVITKTDKTEENVYISEKPSLKYYNTDEYYKNYLAKLKAYLVYTVISAELDFKNNLDSSSITNYIDGYEDDKEDFTKALKEYASETRLQENDKDVIAAITDSLIMESIDSINEDLSEEL